MGGLGRLYVPSLTLVPESRLTSTHKQFPVGMGTSSVYLSLSGWEEPVRSRDMIERIFFFMTVAIFCINVGTLLLQAIREFHSFSSLPSSILVRQRTDSSSFLLSPADFWTVYPKRAWEPVRDPDKGIFIPLMVRALSFR